MGITSEEVFMIKQPYDYQCESIDLMIEKSSEAIEFHKAAIVAIEKQTIIQANREALARVEMFPEQLEEFRTAIENVREWGQQWKNAAKELSDKYEPQVLNPAMEFDDDIPF